MAKVDFKPGNMIYPLPAVLVSCKDKEGKDNILTIAWAGTVCSDPPMVSISVRPERYSYHMIKETGEFVINLTTKDLAFATDYCGVVSGRDVDKWEKCHLTRVPGSVVNAPYIEESPVNIECKVVDFKGKDQFKATHEIFLAKVVAIHCDDAYMDEKNSFHLEKANPLVYIHGQYFETGKSIGKFGYSVQKKNKSQNAKKKD